MYAWVIGCHVYYWCCFLVRLWMMRRWMAVHEHVQSKAWCHFANDIAELLHFGSHSFAHFWISFKTIHWVTQNSHCHPQAFALIHLVKQCPQSSEPNFRTWINFFVVWFNMVQQAGVQISTIFNQIPQRNNGRDNGVHIGNWTMVLYMDH